MLLFFLCLEFKRKITKSKCFDSENVETTKKFARKLLLILSKIGCGRKSTLGVVNASLRLEEKC